jgi:type VI secretion system ImpC/EvpB family protein
MSTETVASHATWAPDAAAPPEEVTVAPHLVGSLLDDLIQSNGLGSPAARTGRLQAFLAAASAGEALRTWFGGQLPGTSDALARALNRAVARIDDLIGRQLNAILHHERFQKLEAAWRGVAYLIDVVESAGEPNVKLRCFPASWKEIEDDFAGALDFDQSTLFRRIYEDEFGTAGGSPFGALIADFEVRPAPARGYPHNDVQVLRSLSQVAAAAFCPTVLNAGPALFGLDRFETLERELDLESTFNRAEYLKWRGLRDTEDSRFLALALPRVLMRLPYDGKSAATAPFRFIEDVTASDRSGYLWGGAAFALGGTLIRAYADCGWFSEIRGVIRGMLGGGLVTDLPTHEFGTDAKGVVTKASTDVTITDQLEKQLSELGFISLCRCYDTPYSAFYSTPSIQRPKRYDTNEATLNARISSMLHYMLCVSRFAHIVKASGRDVVGRFTTPEEIETQLQRWLSDYVTPDDDATSDTKARRPLREADVKVIPDPGKPGSYQAVVRLMPHYQFDDAKASITLVTELASESR